MERSSGTPLLLAAVAMGRALVRVDFVLHPTESRLVSKLACSHSPVIRFLLTEDAHSEIVAFVFVCSQLCPATKNADTLGFVQPF